MTAKTALSVPEALSCRDIKVFVERLLAANGMSIRALCAALDWPASLVNDVMADRKAMTLQRGLELARYLSLDVVSTEQVLLLVLASGKDGPVKRHFASDLAARLGDRLDETALEPGQLDDFPAIAVFALLGWTRKLLPPAAIRDVLYTLEELTDERIAAIIATLRATGLIRVDGDQVEVDRQNFALNADRLTGAQKMRLTKELLENLVRYVDSPRRQSPGTFAFRILSIPERLVKVAEGRFRLIEQWLTDEETRASDGGATGLFEMLFFLAPIADAKSVDASCRR